ncbi:MULTISPECIES: Imm70 family immunity protein [unclassified Halomonas]|uniref:Imm70 family immunity protein n=1 Tax=unclassified Halomonas TaxID=2609666 RepID=UPI0007DA3B73|nr:MULTISPECIES: Imm70 family immunity protein [unclassified Halomonas]MBT2788637.1 immunity 70 family protein [Halomonas sp. ISL-106]MBT2798228.1 immunity 70 family protein [Halomonas sp. ISL-104]OAL60777.1 hypothetical protein A6R74_18875 [Halomonas sp. ALS9]
MTVGFKAGSIVDEIGTADFLHAFFSTVSYNLEEGWGSRFPILLNHLYQGELKTSLAEEAVIELQLIQQELSVLELDRVIWDIENISRQPPWGDDISPQITSLANYFITSTGRDLILTLLEVLGEAAVRKQTVTIVQC